jgi:hypothetical protein
MTARLNPFAPALALAAGVLLTAGSASAQDSQATTRSLNTGPADTTLAPRPNAQPPLSETERTETARSQVAPPRPAQSNDRTLEELLGDTSEETAETVEPAEGVTLAEGETEPPPIPMTLGYYVRGDKDCGEVWPGDGDIAWVTPTAFTIDFGGCEPGQFLQTGPNSWREEQRCVTETGASAGGYSVIYEVIGTDAIKRSARLAIDGSVEEDLWKYCRTPDVPENARFAP